MRALAVAALAALAVAGCGSSGTGSAHPSSPLASPCVASPSSAPASPSPPDLTGYSFQIIQAQTIKQQVIARPELYQFAVQTSWDLGDVQLSLISPSGKVYDRSITDPAAHHHIQGKSETYSLERSLTEPGQWTIQLYGAAVPPAGERVGMGVYQIPLSEFGPIAYASGTPDRGVAPVSVQFSSGGSGAFIGATITGYRWDFGDCSPLGNGPSPRHVYRTAGSFAVTLTVTDSNGQSDSANATIFVTATDQPPTAKFIWASLDAAKPTQVSFDAESSNDIDGTITSYAWDFGDGTSGSGLIPVHDYAKGGSYSVKLTVTDNGGLTDSTCEKVTTGQSLSATIPCLA